MTCTVRCVILQPVGGGIFISTEAEVRCHCKIRTQECVRIARPKSYESVKSRALHCVTVILISNRHALHVTVRFALVLIVPQRTCARILTRKLVSHVRRILTNQVIIIKLVAANFSRWARGARFKIDIRLSSL